MYLASAARISCERSNPQFKVQLEETFLYNKALLWG